MVIWSIMDKCHFILDRTGGPGLAGPEIPNFWAVERSSAARYSPWGNHESYYEGHQTYFISLN